MNKLEKILKNKKIVVIAICIVALIGIGVALWISEYAYKDIDSIDMLESMEEKIEGGNNIDAVNKENINNITENITANEIIEETEKIVIHITGEVKKKGIIYLDKGSRIADAIKAAGGATKNANLDQVNLAYVLEDGQKIYIPNKNEKLEVGAYIIVNSGNNVLIEDGKNSGNTTTSNNTKGVNGKVNINSANQTELETLPGIGPSLAQRIIEYRKSNGNFQNIEDIQNVKGIGDSKYSNIKENICI